MNKAPDNIDELNHFNTALQDAVDHILTNNLDPDDFIGFSFCSTGIEAPGFLAFRKARDLTYNDLWSVISSVFQSNSEGLSTDQFCLTVTTVKLPRGFGRYGRLTAYDSLDDFAHTKKSIINIKNDDEMCLPRAIVVAKAFVDKKIDLYKKAVRKGGLLQLNLALDLMRNANVSQPLHGWGIEELKKFQNYLTDYEIVVYRFEIRSQRKRDIIFKGSNNSDKRINLLFSNNHYNVICSLSAAFQTRKYCIHCETPYDKLHMCNKKCYACLNVPSCIKTADKISCLNCNREFKGQICFDNHKNTNCSIFKRCRICYKTYNVDRIHNCGEHFCQTCKKLVESTHKCYMQVDTRTPPSDDFLFIFYDLETRQEKVIMQKNLDGQIMNVTEHEVLS